MNDIKFAAIVVLTICAIMTIMGFLIQFGDLTGPCIEKGIKSFMPCIWEGPNR